MSLVARAHSPVGILLWQLAGSMWHSLVATRSWDAIPLWSDPKNSHPHDRAEMIYCDFLPLDDRKQGCYASAVEMVLSLCRMEQMHLQSCINLTRCEISASWCTSAKAR